jgi:hypothetical protein
VRLLVSAVAGDVDESVKDVFRACEAEIVEAARRISYGQVRELMAFWHAHADPEGHRRRYASRYARRGLSVSTTIDGMVAVDGLLDPETGQVVLWALDHIGDQLWRAEHRATKGDTPGDESDCAPVGPVRTPRQLRADALGEIARLALGYDRGRDRFDGRHRPRVTATVDIDTLAGRIAARHGASEGVAVLADLNTPIPPEAARRLLCDAGLDTVITNSRFVPLAVSRSHGDIPAAIRRAVVARDVTCAFPGCDLPPRCCDVHHIAHRAHGGPHDITNLVHLCRRHHRLLHDTPWAVRIDLHTGRPVFRDPDGHHHRPDPTPRQVADLAGRPLRRRRTHRHDDDQELPLVS